jgi:hypothetical protein
MIFPIKGLEILDSLLEDTLDCKDLILGTDNKHRFSLNADYNII